MENKICSGFGPFWKGLLISLDKANNVSNYNKNVLIKI